VSAAPPAAEREKSDLAARVLAGDRKAVARAITLVEDGNPEGEALLDALYPRTGRAVRIGITGPPGAGKSTLTSALSERLREEGKTVGIVCVDPTSPFSGGALLGDRIRMGRVQTDPGVFIRSMASRGALGGVSRTTSDALDVLDAAGKDVLLVETVGVGQSEVEVAGAADTVVVVLSPEAGDQVQTMKAGLMEIAHVFVVNKCDREGADRMVRALDAMLELGPATRTADAAAAGAAAGGGGGGGGAAPASSWAPPVVKTVASTGEGVPALLAALEAHAGWCRERGESVRRRRARIAGKVRRLVEERLWRLFWRGEAHEAELSRLADEVMSGRATPHGAAAALVERARAGSG
jgi:LAO/AO transport system kinase